MTTVANLLPDCPSNHLTPLGTILSGDGKIWVVPAETHFIGGPHCADLYNTCNGVTPGNLGAANLSAVPTTTIDPDGDLITGYLFADNYFELFVNGVLVGVDPVPFTPFNACVVKFRVKKPYTLAVKLVDWEENLGLGTEINNGNFFHPGDGGFIAQFSDGTVTDATWRAQTFYIAPIQDLNTVVEAPDGTHSTAAATLTPSCNAQCYGVHYAIPAGWMEPGFDASGWPVAALYAAAQVTNQAAFKNFESTAWGNARFIWTSNLVLDNVVLTRKTVGVAAVADLEAAGSITVEQPFSDGINLIFKKDLSDMHLRLFSLRGQLVAQWPKVSGWAGEKRLLDLPAGLPAGAYFLFIHHPQCTQVIQLIQNNF
jgi:hypothetical protein